MLLKLLAKADGQWRVIAPAQMLEGKVLCELEQELLAFTEQHAASVVGLMQFWENIPRVGPRQLGTAIYHCVDDEHGIFEFVKGRLRVLCFQSDGAICVCCHAFLKQTQKTPKPKIKRAVGIKKEYEAALASGKVEIKAEEDS